MDILGASGLPIAEVMEGFFGTVCDRWLADKLCRVI
jgi:hypothetical protein